MNIRNLKVFSLSLTSILFLSSCSIIGNSASETPEPTEPPKVVVSSHKTTATPTPIPEYENGKLIINFAGVNDGTEGTAKLIKAYNAQSESVVVKFLELPSDFKQRNKKLIGSLELGKTDFDVFEADISSTAELASKKYVLAVDDYVSSGEIVLENYFENTIKATTYNGKLWGIPQNISTNFLYIRNDLISTTPKTWNDLVAYAEKSSGTGKAKYGFLIGGQSSESLVCTAMEFIYSYGGEIFDASGKVAINSPKAIKGLNKMLSIYKSSFVPQNIAKMTNTDVNNAFIKGEGIFMQGLPYSWLLGNSISSKVNGKFSIAPLSAGDAGSATILGGNS